MPTHAGRARSVGRARRTIRRGPPFGPRLRAAVPRRPSPLPLAALAALLAVALAPAAHAQVPERYRTPSLPGTAPSGIPDSLRQAGAAPETGEPIRLPVPQAAAAPGGLERPVAYTARDSLRVVLARRAAGPDSVEAGDVVSLFGNVEAQYEGASITAGRVDYDSRAQALRAAPMPGDSASVPRFQGEEGEFTGEGFVYNLRTQRGRVTAARTAIEDGYLLGGIIKQQDAHVVFAQDAAYTTCTLDHPHYALEAGRIKIVDGKRVYTGPVQLTLLGIPMPLVLPFGYFPAAQGRRSGPLALDYGQDTNFGLYLGNVGWYWAISDYLDAQVTSRIGTLGSFQVSGAVGYNRRYAYNGNLRLSAGRLVSGERTDPGGDRSRIPLSLQWSHNQTFPAGQQLTGSVNLQTTSERQAAQEVSNQIQSTTSSTVSYRQQWPSAGRSLTVSGQVQQDFANERTQAQFPQVLFGQDRLFPFRRGRDDRWYEKVSLSYTADARNAFSYQALGDSTVGVLEALTSPSAYLRGACAPEDLACTASRFDYQVVQRVPVNANFSVPRFNLNLSPSLNYVETWTGEAIEQTYDPATGRAVSSEVPRFTAVRQATASLSASTEFFGTFPLRVGRVDGLRHTVSPQVSLSYQPDYARFGFVKEVQVDSLGNTRRYAVNPSIPISPTRSLTFNVANAFLARTVRTDTTGAEQRQTRQVLSLNVNGGYNFAAERRPFQDLSTTFTTEFFGFNASGNAQLSFYAPDTASVTLPAVTYFDATGRPLRVATAGFQVSRSFSSRRTTGPSDVRPVTNRAFVDPQYDPNAGAPRSATVGYLDYSAPWSFSAGLSVRTSDGNGISEGTTTAAIDVNQFRAQLTPKWALNGSTGLDLTTMEITQTRLSLTRDLHCWEMAVNWQPIGRTRLFSVSLYVKGGFLSDLLRLDVPNSTVRSQGFGRGLAGRGGFGGRGGF